MSEKNKSINKFINNTNRFSSLNDSDEENVSNEILDKNVPITINKLEENMLKQFNIKRDKVNKSTKYQNSSNTPNHNTQNISNISNTPNITNIPNKFICI